MFVAIRLLRMHVLSDARRSHVEDYCGKPQSEWNIIAAGKILKALCFTDLRNIMTHCNTHTIFLIRHVVYTTQKLFFN